FRSFPPIIRKRAQEFERRTRSICLGVPSRSGRNSARASHLAVPVSRQGASKKGNTVYKTPLKLCRKSTGFWLLALVVAFPAAANAGITQINITRVESPTFEGRSFGSVGQYEKLVGTIHGEVDPADRRNAGIINIARAPRNPAGHVEYDVDLYILKPIDPSRGSNHLYYDVNNRGNLLAIQF